MLNEKQIEILNQYGVYAGDDCQSELTFEIGRRPFAVCVPAPYFDKCERQQVRLLRRSL